MNGRAFLLTRHPQLALLAEAQHSVATRSQLDALDVRWTHVREQLRGERWREPSPGVVVLHNGPLSPGGARWVAVLAAGPQAALCSWTSLELWGLRGWERRELHLVVPRGTHAPSLPDVVIHESRRHTATDILKRAGLPVHGVARSAVDAGAWSGSPRTAAGLMAAVVQQRLAPPEQLRQTLDAAGRVRQRKGMFLALVDIEGGADALSEIDIARLCRSAGLPEPTRQRIRLDTDGRRRYLDVEWELDDGRTIGLEIDGPGHMEARRWYDDLMRDAELVVPERHRIIRLPSSAVRLEPERVARILARALAPLAGVSTWQRPSVASC